ncbi:MAG: helix-turn-helix domain-containing protein [Chthoniobacter sp.]|nr:helix-turn-helix domain-containing protein [Chthoniobacter sp.]
MGSNSTITVETAVQQMLMDACLPPVQGILDDIKRQLAAMREELRQSRSAKENDDGWLDARAAAKYLSMSATTFDKHRYSSSPKIPGSRVGGKMLYKRSDLDNWVRLHEIKSSGLA